MLKLEPLSPADKEKHFALLYNRFYEKVAPDFLDLDDPSQQLIDYLSERLHDILLGPPEMLEKIASDASGKFAAFHEFAGRKNKGTDPVDDMQRKTLKLIHNCFNYDWFSDQRKGWGAYALVLAYATRICPYCQAHHINYHVTPALSTAPFHMRPPLDHYLPKSKYPYLAVSLSNLIPSCVQCNSGVKTVSDPLGRGLLHPLDATAVNVRFSIAGSYFRAVHGKIDIDDIKLILTGMDTASTKHISEFKLEPRYGWYRHEVKDMLDRNTEYEGLDAALRSLISRELYVLGFLEDHAKNRATGLCLRDIYHELKTGGARFGATPSLPTP